MNGQSWTTGGAATAPQVSLIDEQLNAAWVQMARLQCHLNLLTQKLIPVINPEHLASSLTTDSGEMKVLSPVAESIRRLCHIAENANDKLEVLTRQLDL